MTGKSLGVLHRAGCSFMLPAAGLLLDAGNSFTNQTTPGITTLQMGVFGGIMIGLGTAALHTRLYRLQEAQSSFFVSSRSVHPLSVETPRFMAAHMNGTVVPMAQVRDEVFASRVLGEGVAIEPDDGRLFAPAAGKIGNLFATHHAVSLVTEEGAALLLHIGINTVELGNRHFTTHVEAGQRVRKGDLLISFDLEAVKAAGYLCTTPMIVCNTDHYRSVTPAAEGRVRAGTPLLELRG